MGTTVLRWRLRVIEFVKDPQAPSPREFPIAAGTSQLKQGARNHTDSFSDSPEVRTQEEESSSGLTGMNPGLGRAGPSGGSRGAQAPHFSSF